MDFFTVCPASNAPRINSSHNKSDLPCSFPCTFPLVSNFALTVTYLWLWLYQQAPLQCRQAWTGSRVFGNSPRNNRRLCKRCLWYNSILPYTFWFWHTFWFCPVRGGFKSVIVEWHGRNIHIIVVLCIQQIGLNQTEFEKCFFNNNSSEKRCLSLLKNKSKIKYTIN